MSRQSTEKFQGSETIQKDPITTYTSPYTCPNSKNVRTKGDPNRNCELWVVTVGQPVQVCTAVAGLSVLFAYPAANLKPSYKCIGNNEE